MKDDEPRRDDQTLRVDLASARNPQIALRDDRDLPPVDPDVPDGVEARLRVHDPAVADDGFVVADRCRSAHAAGEEEKQERDRSHPEDSTHRLQIGRASWRVRWTEG